MQNEFNRGFQLAVKIVWPIVLTLAVVDIVLVALLLDFITARTVERAMLETVCTEHPLAPACTGAR